MLNLIKCIEQTPLSRSAWTKELTAIPVAFVFHPQNEAEALEWFRITHGRDPEYIVCNKEIDFNTSAKRIRFEQILSHTEAYPLVFWRNCRPLALKLSNHNVQSFRFSHDPAYKKVKFDPEFLQNYRSNLEEIFDLMFDEESKRTLASVIKYRITGEHGYLRMATYIEYEHPIVKAETNEWVIDCGASNGATSFRFARHVGKGGTVYAFEPDPTNIKRIHAKIDKDPDAFTNLTVVNAAVSNENGTIRFSGDQGGSSRISPDGNIQVAVRTIDHFARSSRLNGPGLISLDVEGYEHNALEGGLETIRTLRPKLQISAYHKTNDIFSLPLWVRDNIPDYVFFMGHHESYHTETDIYAIPRERFPPIRRKRQR